MAGGDQGTTLGAQVLGLLLATNRTMNVGLPTVSLLLEDRQHPGLEMGGKGGLRRPQAHPTPASPKLAQRQNPVYPWDPKTSTGLQPSSGP